MLSIGRYEVSKTRSLNVEGWEELRRGLHRQWQAVTIKQDITPAYIDEFIALLSRPAMPLGKAGIVRFVSSKR